MATPVPLNELKEMIGSAKALQGLLGDGLLLVMGIAPPEPGAALDEPTRTVRIDAGDDTHTSNKLLPFALLGSESTVFPVETSPDSAFPGVITIGRLKTSDIVLESPSVSKLHALIKGTADTEWTLTDNGSLNGTSLNGHDLEPSKSYPLQVGDEVSLGGVRGMVLDAAGVASLGRVGK